MSYSVAISVFLGVGGREGLVVSKILDTNMTFVRAENTDPRTNDEVKTCDCSWPPKHSVIFDIQCCTGSFQAAREKNFICLLAYFAATLR